MKIHLPKNIKYLRKQKGWSQKDLGDQLGKTHAAIGTWENLRNSPPVDAVIYMAKVFQVGVEDFLFKDLEREEYESVENVSMSDNEMLKRMNQLLEYQIKSYEEKIKEKAPELAKELGLE